MAKKKSEKGRSQPAVKRQRSDVQHNRHRIYQAYVVQPSINSSPVSAVSPSGHSSSSTGALGKCRHKGKGKYSPKGNRTGTSSPLVGFSGQPAHKGKGGHTNFAKGKCTFSAKGKIDKGKGSRYPANSPSIPRLQCKFCHLHGQNCRKKQALQTLPLTSRLASNLLLLNSLLSIS
jgi:hypothetical protein